MEPSDILNAKHKQAGSVIFQSRSSTPGAAPVLSSSRGGAPPTLPTSASGLGESGGGSARKKPIPPLPFTPPADRVPGRKTSSVRTRITNEQLDAWQQQQPPGHPPASQQQAAAAPGSPSGRLVLLPDSDEDDEDDEFAQKVRRLTDRFALAPAVGGRTPQAPVWRRPPVERRMLYRERLFGLLKASSSASALDSPLAAAPVASRPLHTLAAKPTVTTLATVPLSASAPVERDRRRKEKKERKSHHAIQQPLPAEPELRSDKRNKGKRPAEPLVGSSSAPVSAVAVAAPASRPLSGGGSLIELRGATVAVLTPQPAPAPTRPPARGSPALASAPGTLDASAGKKKEDKRMKGVKFDLHRVSLDELARRLGTDLRRGLARDEAARRRHDEGPNVPRVNTGRTTGRVDEVQHDWEYLQLTDQLDQFAAMRDGRLVLVRRSGLVRGDIVWVLAGQEVPADLRLLWASADLAADHTNVTTSSKPVPRGLASADVLDSPLDSANMLWARTWLTHGAGKGVVVGTGTQALLYRLTTQIESVTWVKLTPPLVTLSRRCMQRANAFIKRFEAAPPLADATVLVADPVALCSSASAQPQAWVFDLQVRPFEVLDERTCPPPAPGPSAAPSSSARGTSVTSGSALARAISLCNLLPSAVPVADPPTAAPFAVEGYQGMICPQSGLSTEPIDAVLLTCLTAPLFEKHRVMYQPVHVATNSALYALPEAPGEFLLVEKGPLWALLPSCNRIYIQGRPEPLTEERILRMRQLCEELERGSCRVVTFTERMIRAPGNADPVLIAKATAPTDATLIGALSIGWQAEAHSEENVAALEQLGVRVILATNESPHFAAGWLQRLGLAGRKTVVDLTPSAREGQAPAAVKALTLEADALANIALAAAGTAARVELVNQLQKRKHTVLVQAHAPEDDWALRAADAVIANAHASYMAKVVADVVLTDGRLSSVLTLLREARGEARVQMQDIKLLEGNVVTLPPQQSAACTIS